jgi:SAM-dependent methyltransferase
MKSLDGRKPQSLEIQHVVDYIPNKYAVTDKADGERYFLIIYDNNVYLISDNLHVKNTGIILNKSESKYNNTILDGEYIFIQEENRHLFMIFDCLYQSNNDIRNTINLMDRLKAADEVIEACFILKGQKGHIHKLYDDAFNPDKMVAFYKKGIKEFMSSINHDLKVEKQYPLIRRKYFIPVTGGQDNEIFKFSELLWNSYVIDSSIGCPYILDGLIYQPLDQKYVTSSKESKLLDYKWKPPQKNSIDFYIQYEKNPDTGKEYVIYDNSHDDYIKGKPYKIVNLYVGKNVRDEEIPVLFQEDSYKYMAYLFLEDGEVRDQEGNIILDSTVVEFYYNDDQNISSKYRWVPIRTRHDKTESVHRYRKKYGNYIDIANKVWRSIENPFLMSDIATLAIDDNYTKHINLIRGKIDHSIILSERQENAYYQKTSNLAKSMRAFHNWIKSILIYTYCNPVYENGKNMSILDMGCGRGGDLMKFYYVAINFYLGVDLDNNGLISPVNGAISRYLQHKKTHANFPRMVFINADCGALLNYDEQLKVLGAMTPTNKELIDKYFGNNLTQFDRINCQMALHYFLKNETVWSNFIQNINSHLKPGGMMIITTFDAKSIIDALGGKDQYTLYYTDAKGEQEVLIDMVKKFKDEDVKKKVFGVGHGIDLYNSMYSQEGKYITEYLVQKEFLISEFASKCDMSLIDTDTFGNQYYMQEDYIKNYGKYEDNQKTQKFLLSVQPFYDLRDEITQASLKLSKLYRYYIFRKNDTAKKSKPQKGGRKAMPKNVDTPLNDVTDFFETGSFVRRPIKSSTSFLNSIHDVLKESSIIPQTVDPITFYKDIGFNMLPDNDMNTSSIKKVIRRLVITHEVGDEQIISAENSISSVNNVETVLNGVNIIVVDKSSCKYSDADIVSYGKRRSKPSVILYKDENENYHPIYKLAENGENGVHSVMGLFDSKSALIKKLMDNAEKY